MKAGKPKGLAVLLGIGKPSKYDDEEGPESEESEDEGDDDEMLTGLGQDALDALEAKDALAFASALKAISRC